MTTINGRVRVMVVGPEINIVFGHIYGGSHGCPDFYAEVRQRIGTGNYVEVRIGGNAQTFATRQDAERWLDAQISALPFGLLMDAADLAPAGRR